MEESVAHAILTATQASRMLNITLIQELWSGYGQILRCTLEGGSTDSVIVKRVRWQAVANHPRGWDTDHSHQRKLRSYQVEMNWYQGLARQTSENCRIPQVLAVQSDAEHMLIIMEDLDAAGFSARKSTVGREEIHACLQWLAAFHAAYMGVRSEELWDIGTYWHLATRPDELDAMQDIPLKNAASQIDQKLNQANYQTLVHGDAKLANFCFSEDVKNVAAVDFQYVGHGCGMKDVAYFLSSCLHEEELSYCESALLSFYFEQLELELKRNGRAADFQQIKVEWIKLYPYAWTDFYRFLDGWSPGHWKMHTYSRAMKASVLKELEINT